MADPPALDEIKNKISSLYNSPEYDIDPVDVVHLVELLLKVLEGQQHEILALRNEIRNVQSGNCPMRK